MALELESVSFECRQVDVIVKAVVDEAASSSVGKELDGKERAKEKGCQKANSGLSREGCADD